MKSWSGESHIQPIIASTKNAWVQQVVQLHRARDRYAQRRFLIEGEHAVQEAIGTGWPIERIAMTERYLRERAKKLGPFSSELAIQPVSESVMAKLATTESPDGVLAIGCFVEQKGAMGVQNSLGTVPLIVAVERLQDPGNVGTLVRSSVACEAEGLLLSEGSVDPYHPKVLRSTAGQWFRRPPATCNLQEKLREWRSIGVQILGAAAGGRCYWDFDLTAPTAFVLGNEGAGLSESVLDQVDEIISIPMKGDVESLNVAMSGTLLLYEAYRQRDRRRPSR